MRVRERRVENTSARAQIDENPILRSGCDRRAVLAAALALVGCSIPLRQVRYKYVVRVEATVAGERCVGESVIKNIWRDQRGGLHAGSQFVTRVWAEATIVSTSPQDSQLFALLQRKRSGGFFYPAYVFPQLLVGLLQKESAEERYQALQQVPEMTEEVIVPQTDWPLFVEFRDLLDPTSVREVNPDGGRLFDGAEVNIDRVSMRLTDAVTTHKIERLLPWLEVMRGTLGGEMAARTRGPLKNQLSTIDFVIRGLQF